MSSGKATSWAVAAGVAAVEALKDQAGLCRWNYAFRSLQHHAKRKISAGQARKISAGMMDHSGGGRNSAAAAARAAEKADNVMNLVCWGPR